MDHDYDVFEVYPDHTIRRRICVHGVRPALDTLEALAKQTVMNASQQTLARKKLSVASTKGGRLRESLTMTGRARSRSQKITGCR